MQQAKISLWAAEKAPPLEVSMSKPTTTRSNSALASPATAKLKGEAQRHRMSSEWEIRRDIPQSSKLWDTGSIVSSTQLGLEQTLTAGEFGPFFGYQKAVFSVA